MKYITYLLGFVPFPPFVYLQTFLSIFGVQQLQYKVSKCFRNFYFVCDWGTVYLGIYPASRSMNFLNQWFYTFSYFWKILDHYIFKYFLCSTFFLFFSDSNCIYIEKQYSFPVFDCPLFSYSFLSLSSMFFYPLCLIYWWNHQRNSLPLFSRVCLFAF